jgi:hypothetical protein
LAAVVPSLVLAVAIALRPPRPARLRAIGWSLVGVTTIAAVVLVVGLRMT